MCRSAAPARPTCVRIFAPYRPLNNRTIASQITRAISEKPEIGLAAGGGAAGGGGVEAAAAADDGALGAAALGVAVRDAASCALRLSANCFISCDAVAWIMPTPRPYCATAPESDRSVCTSTFEPPGTGSRRNEAAAFAPPRPLASVPCAFTRAVWLSLSISSNLTRPAKVSATGPRRTALWPLYARLATHPGPAAPGMQGAHP